MTGVLNKKYLYIKTEDGKEHFFIFTDISEAEELYSKYSRMSVGFNVIVEEGKYINLLGYNFNIVIYNKNLTNKNINKYLNNQTYFIKTNSDLHFELNDYYKLNNKILHLYIIS